MALVPLLMALVRHEDAGFQAASFARAFFLGLLTGIVWFGGTLYWLTDVMVTFGGLAYPIAVPAALLLIAYLALFPAGVAVVVARACRRFGLEGLFVLPAAWVCAEYLRGHLLTGFPWVPLGNSQVDVTPVAQAASLVGVYGLSGLVTLPAAAMVYAWHRPGRSRTLSLSATALVLAAVVAWGTWRTADTGVLEQGSPVRIALVQGNVPQGEKWDPDLASAIYARYLRLSREAIQRGATLVLWPESATPFMFEERPDLANEVRLLAREAGVSFLIGSDQVERTQPPRFFNSALLIQPTGLVGGAYRKMNLVPFGEYVPLKRLLFFAAPLVEAAGEFAPGEQLTVFPVGDGTISTAICYEVVFPELAREAVARGSRLLSTLTNDAWYGATSAPWQHFAQARVRAIEQGRFLIRAANTGISGIVDPFGRVVQRSGLFEEAVLVGDVRFLDDRTVYARIGDAPVHACFLLTALVCVWPVRRRPHPGT